MDVLRIRGRKLLIAGAFCLRVMVGEAWGGDLDNWALTNSLPRNANRFFSVRSGGTSFLAVGDFGAALDLAPTGYLRGSLTPPTDQTLLDSAYGDGVWVVVGEKGTILAGATNSVQRRFTWTNVASGTGETLAGVAWSNGRWVAVGDHGTILASTNLFEWRSASSPTDVVLRGITCHAGRWVAVGGDILAGVILTSTNGMDWLSQAAPAVLYGVAGATNGQWVAVGEFGSILHSDDGLNWRTVTSSTAATLMAVTSGTNGTWTAVGRGGTILTSRDGELWTSIQSGTTEDLFGVASLDPTYRNGTWVAVGANGTAISSNGGRPLPLNLYASPVSMSDVTNGNGTWVMVGNYYSYIGLFGYFTAGTLFTSIDGTRWRPVLVKPGEAFQRVDYANGLWIATGTNANGGFIRASTNGVDWPEQNLGPSVPGLHGVAASPDRWIAVGDRGLILTSSNGLEWTEIASGTTNNLRAVGYNGTWWVAVGDRGTVLVSNDGVIWEARTSGTSNQLLDIAYGAGRWVASGVAVVLSSADTLAWNPTPFNGTFGHVRYEDGLWVTWTDGLLLTSYDGLHWTAHSLFAGASMLFNIGPGIWDAVGNGAVWRSPRFWVDSLTVTPRPTGQLVDIWFNLGILTALGAETALSLQGVGSTSLVLAAGSLMASNGIGTNVPSGAYHVIWDTAATLPRETYLPAATLQLTASALGYTITSRSATFTVDLRSFADPWLVRQDATNLGSLTTVAYGGGRWIASGYSTLLTSTNASFWTGVKAGVVGWAYGLAYHDGTWVAADWTDVLVSRDLITWTRVPNVSSNWLSTVRYGGSQWVAVGGSGTIIISQTGTKWTQVVSGLTDDLHSLDYGDGLWACVGVNRLLTSPDAVHWVSPPTASSVPLTAVRFNQGRWVAVGFDGTTLTSTDGLTWTRGAAGVYLSLQSVDYGDGLWVAVGDSGTMVSSVDGLHWTVRNSGTTVNLRGVAYGNWRWVAVGDGGIILSTGTVRPAVDLTLHTSGREPDGGLVLGVTVVAGESYRLQATTNLVDWTTVTNFVPVTNDFEVTDPQADQPPPRFYRLVSP